MTERGRRPHHSRLYVAEWTSRALHGTAIMLNRLSEEQDLSDRQEWLWHRIIDELEFRHDEAIRRTPWTACSCWLCFSPFPRDEPDYESDDGGDALPESRPDGEPISRQRTERTTEQKSEQEQPNHIHTWWQDVELPFED